MPETQLEDLPTQQLPQETPQKAPVKTRFALGKLATVGDSQRFFGWNCPLMLFLLSRHS